MNFPSTYTAKFYLKVTDGVIDQVKGRFFTFVIAGFAAQSSRIRSKSGFAEENSHIRLKQNPCNGLDRVWDAS